MGFQNNDEYIEIFVDDNSWGKLKTAGVSEDGLYIDILAHMTDRFDFLWNIMGKTHLIGQEMRYNGKIYVLSGAIICTKIRSIYVWGANGEWDQNVLEQ